MEIDLTKYVGSLITSLFAAIVAGATMLHKGVWKAININTKDLDDTRTRVAHLEGRCETMHQAWNGHERRREPR